MEKTDRMNSIYDGEGTDKTFCWEIFGEKPVRKLWRKLQRVR